MFKTEFDFTLPKGFLDGEGNLHRQGVMRLAKAADEITPMRDPRVRSNPAYATVLILARVIVRLGVLEEVSPRVIEDLYAIDLNYLYDLYQQLNGSVEKKSSERASEKASEQATAGLGEELVAELGSEDAEDFEHEDFAPEESETEIASETTGLPQPAYAQ